MHFYYRILLSFVFYFPSYSFSQSVLIPFREGNLWGFADTNGTIQIKPAFDKVDFYNDSKNTAEVGKNNKVSLINKQGTMLFPFSDSYEPFGDYFNVTFNGKKDLYTKQGKQLIRIEYDYFEWPFAYEKYRNEVNKIIGFKNGEYFLIDLKTAAIKKIPRTIDSNTSETFEGITEMPVNESDGFSVPVPQLQSCDFPKLKGYKNLVHCKTIYKNQRPVFYVFCLWKDSKMIGYIGQNGVVFYRD